MSPRLGELLVQEGACTPSAVQEALRNQVIFGGRLGTNLLELGAVTEEALAHALARKTGAKPLFGDLAPDPRAVRLLDRRMADRWDVVPYMVADRQLALVARDPGDLQMLDEVAFATGKRVHAFVVPEARVWLVLRQAFGIHRELRGLDVDWATLAPGAAGVVAARAPTAAGGDLMDEGEFQALYGQLAGGASPTPAPAPARAPAAPPPPEADDLETLEVLDEGVPPLSADVLAALGSAPGHQPPVRLAPPPPSAPPAAPEPEPTPLTFAEAVQLLQGVAERTAIARAVLRYARSRFERAVLLTVRRGEAFGWAGLGGGLTPEAVHRLHVRLGTPGVLDTVVTTQAHYLGPLLKTDANLRLLKGLGGGAPRNALLVPVLGLGRVVNVLYADAGRGRLVDGSDLGELLILATRISQSYDDLARRAV